MKYNNHRIINLAEVIKSAEQITKEKHYKFRILVKIFISRRIGKYLLLCFAYLRWIDDFIDDKSNTIAEKRIFLANQKSLFESISNGNSSCVKVFEENFLLYYLDYAISINSTVLIDGLRNILNTFETDVNKLSINSTVLIDGLRNILNTFETDVNKLENNGLITQNELDKYIGIQTKALFNIIYNFLMHNSELNINYCVLPSFYHIDLLRDLKEDADMGYINVNIEDINEFKLNYYDLMNDKNLPEWIMFKLNEIEQILDGELEVIKKMPFKVKLFFYGLFPYINTKILRLRTYNYKLKGTVEETLMKEIKIYFLSIIHAIKFIKKIFFGSINLTDNQ
jgi:hypothetical protein